MIIGYSRTFGGGGGGGNLMPDPGFDNPSAWNNETETQITGSVLDYNTTANFRDCYTETGFRPTVAENTTYNFSVEATISTAARFRIGVTQYAGTTQVVGISYFIDQNPMNSGTISGSFTTSATVDNVRITLQSVLNPFVGTFDDISLTSA